MGVINCLIKHGIKKKTSAEPYKLPFDVTYGENLVQQNSITPSAERQIERI